MAWALQFNGVDESVNIPCATGSATISIKLAADIPAWGGSDEFLFDGRAGTSTYYLRRSGSALRLGISNYKINNISVTADAIFNAVAGDVISFTVSVNGSFTLFGRGTGGAHLNTLIEYVELDYGVGVTQLNDATASDHSVTGLQPVLVDTVGSNNATGSGFDTSTNNYWVNLGGGAGAEQDLTLVNTVQSSSATLLTASQAFVGQSINSEQLTTASLLSVGSAGSQTVVITSAEQLTDATTVSVDQAFTTVSTNAEQLTDATTVSVDQAFETVITNAAQVTDATTVSVDQAFATVSTNAEQLTTATTLAIDTAGSQTVTIINAAQVTDATTVSVDQAFATVSTNAEQLTTASLLSVTSAGSQTVVISDAVQTTDATTVSVDQTFTTVSTNAEQDTTASVITVPDQDAFTLVNAIQTTSSDIIEASQAFITQSILSEQNTIASISFIPDDVTVINVTSFNLKQPRYRMKVK